MIERVKDGLHACTTSHTASGINTETIRNCSRHVAWKDLRRANAKAAEEAVAIKKRRHFALRPGPVQDLESVVLELLGLILKQVFAEQLSNY